MLLITASLINNNIFFQSFAQTNTTNVNENTASLQSIQNKDNNNVSNVKDTFTLSGPISSLVYVPTNNMSNTSNVTGQLNSISKFILSGNWSISVKKGEITNFKTHFIKILADGSKRHTHDLINFKQDNNTKAQLTADNSLSVKGLVNVKLNNNIPWNNTKVDISLAKGNTIAIKLNNKQTSNHFEDQPINGIVTSIIDGKGTKIKLIGG